MSTRSSAKQVIRASGWVIALGGPITSYFTFRIDHMTADLWWLIAIGTVASVIVGAGLLWLSR